MVSALQATYAEKAQGSDSVTTDSDSDADADAAAAAVAAAAARAQDWAEAQRKDFLEGRQLKFARELIDAQTELPPADKEAGFEEYWQGEGWVNGTHYTKPGIMTSIGKDYLSVISSTLAAG